MTLGKKTPTISNKKPATSVSPLDAQASPKNDNVYPHISERVDYGKGFSNEEMELISHAMSIIESKWKQNNLESFNSPIETKQYITMNVSHLEREVFGVIFLDNQNRLIANEFLFYGTIDAASVYPREVIKRALELNSAAIMFYHNHPSGIAEPSQSDRRITRKLIDALNTVDIRVLDHFVSGGTDVVSFAERGWI
ncbi:RadC family protein [Vibrio mediterranei]|uniref:RadC family protein n=1 Tax=Vibrio mediterranei TaxID=689 RepID=UPI001EFEC154|nr:DNA repair protein RadC [Vibrio mediterranei]MCG9660446.1 DNA repair protein RadC [Vibrio mediterranei]